MLEVSSVEERIYPVAGVLFEFSFTFPLKRFDKRILQSSSIIFFVKTRVTVWLDYQ